MMMIKEVNEKAYLQSVRCRNCVVFGHSIKVHSEDKELPQTGQLLQTDTVTYHDLVFI